MEKTPGSSGSIVLKILARILAKLLLNSWFKSMPRYYLSITLVFLGRRLMSQRHVPQAEFLIIHHQGMLLKDRGTFTNSTGVLQTPYRAADRSSACQFVNGVRQHLAERHCTLDWSGSIDLHQSSRIDLRLRENINRETIDVDNCRLMSPSIRLNPASWPQSSLIKGQIRNSQAIRSLT